MKLLCECNSWTCDKAVDLSFEQAKKIELIPNSVVIVNGCSPEPTDILIKEESGYSVFVDQCELDKKKMQGGKSNDSKTNQT